MSFVAPPGHPDRSVHAGGPARAAPQGDTGTLGGLLGKIDDVGVAWAHQLRGRRWADVGAAVLSNLSDHGAVWVIIAGAKARRRGPKRGRAVAALAGAGICSYTVNRAVKRVVGRERPGAAVPVAASALAGPPAVGQLPVRRPTSSSFPSGHTLAAFCTAIALSDGPAETAAALAFAAAVAASRVQLRAHHLSDVVGGAVIGAATGVVVRAVLDRVVPRPRGTKPPR